ncbi:uncharacterized protein LOC134832300 [Culicoides brevitarsis]|uniref:uncharacterized protein LOC134832300 n=1 Tax=Culicoides brevitarsis TaxID=469753 RepID=UPI00307BB0C5
MQNNYYPSPTSLQKSTQQQNFFSPFTTSTSDRPHMTSTPQRFLLPTTSLDVHTVPQSGTPQHKIRDNRLSSGSSTNEKMFVDDSSSRSYSPDTSSEGELCIDESFVSTSETETPPQGQKRRRMVSISPAASLQLSLLDRYKIPSNIPVVYHKNMARQFPEAQGKTAQQKIQRKKNTEAARQSRAKAKILETIVESECRQAATENVNAKRMIATQRAYANTLLKLLAQDEVDWTTKWRDEHEPSRLEVTI